MSVKAKPVASLVSLGCPKNLVDSEKLMARFAEAGYAISLEIDGSDVVVVNTCGFLESARDESMEVIEELTELKREGRIGGIVVAGCMPMLSADDIIAAAPEVDVVIGVNDRDRVVDLLRQAAASSRGSDGGKAHIEGFSAFAARLGTRRAVVDDLDRVRLTAPHTAYLRVAEGCSQGCSFCTIPRIRGPFRSKPLETVLDEARQLVDSGAVELNVIAQDTTAYGSDLDDGASLSVLLERLAGIDGVRWLRLLYAYPTGVDERLIDVIAGCEKVVNYLDMPLQHIADAVLRPMGRRIGGSETRALLDKLRSRIEGLILRTTFIVGHPGESEAAFEELHAFVSSFGFDALGVFAWSPEPGTPSAKMARDVAPELAAERLEAIMLTQQEKVFEANAAAVGRRMRLLVDGTDSRGVGVARHYGQAPEIDSLCLLTEPVAPGRLIDAEIVDYDDYDLVAEPLG